MTGQARRDRHLRRRWPCDQQRKRAAKAGLMPKIGGYGGRVVMGCSIAVVTGPSSPRSPPAATMGATSKGSRPLSSGSCGTSARTRVGGDGIDRVQSPPAGPGHTRRDRHVRRRWALAAESKRVAKAGLMRKIFGYGGWVATTAGDGDRPLAAIATCGDDGHPIATRSQASLHPRTPG